MLLVLGMVTFVAIESFDIYLLILIRHMTRELVTHNGASRPSSSPWPEAVSVRWREYTAPAGGPPSLSVWGRARPESATIRRNGATSRALAATPFIDPETGMVRGNVCPGPLREIFHD